MDNVQSGTIIRTVVLIFALANQGLTLAGFNPLPFNNEQLENFVVGTLTVWASMWAWWKNNSFTKEARKADKVLIQLKYKKEKSSS